MEKFLHKSLTIIKQTTFILLVVIACWGVSGFKAPDQTSPVVQVVKCYPNPATSFVNFEFPKSIDRSNTLLVYSFVGKKMAELPVTNNKLVITLTDYYRGVYVYQLRDKGGNVLESGKFSVIK